MTRTDEELAYRVRRAYDSMFARGLITWGAAVTRWAAANDVRLVDGQVPRVVARIEAYRAKQANPDPVPQLTEPEKRTLKPRPKSAKGRVIRKGEFPGTHVKPPED